MRTTTILAAAALLGLGAMALHVRAVESDLSWHRLTVEHRLKRLCEEHVNDVAAERMGDDPDQRTHVLEQAARASRECQRPLSDEMEMPTLGFGLHVAK